LADRSAPPITIGDLYAGKTIQLCATGDPVCYPGGLNRAAHSSYKSNGMADQAADYVAGKLGGAAPSATLLQTAAQVDAGN
jgi:cutinase